MDLDSKLEMLIVAVHPTLLHRLNDLSYWLGDGGHNDTVDALRALIEEENKIEVLRNDAMIEKLKVFILGEVQTHVDRAYTIIENEKKHTRDMEETYNNFLGLIDDGVLDDLYKHFDEVAQKIDDCCVVHKSHLSHSLKTNNYRDILKKFEAIQYTIKYAEHPYFIQSISRD